MSEGTLRLALAQMTSARAREANAAWVRDAAARAAGEGAELLALPEVAGAMDRGADPAAAPAAEDDLFVAACREAAAAHGIWISTGSSPVRGPGGRMLNHGDMIDASGAIFASYDKIHLFDVALDGAEPTGESRRYAPGGRAVLARTPWGPVGLSICYDLRFPQLYRDYAQAGARLLLVPSAFTVPTGRAHWEILLRARAIENGAFVVAPAQVGQHEDGRRTWGHALAVGPWGEVLADLGGEAPGLAVIDLDLAQADAARRQIPSLSHGRAYAPPSAP